MLSFSLGALAQEKEPFNQLFNSSPIPLRPAKSLHEGPWLWGTQCNWQDNPSVWKGGPVSNYNRSSRWEKLVWAKVVREGFLEQKALKGGRAVMDRWHTKVAWSR